MGDINQNGNANAVDAQSGIGFAVPKWLVIAARVSGLLMLTWILFIFLYG